MFLSRLIKVKETMPISNGVEKDEARDWSITEGVTRYVHGNDKISLVLYYTLMDSSFLSFKVISLGLLLHKGKVVL